MPVPIITIAQMRQWEAATWATGQTEAAVIQLVGQAVARRATDLTAPGDSILILAGRGHNGADARAAAPHLTNRQVRVVEVGDPQTAMLQIEPALAAAPSLIVDGLFGIGLNRPLAAEWVELIARINAANRPVLAVDVPSGLNADTGEPMGAVVRATVTLTVGAPKAGLLRPAAVPFVNRLEVAADVGLCPCPCQADVFWTLPEDFVGLPPPRPANAHKGTFGHLAIVAGSMGFHGAAVLATRGAQRAQPGLITLWTGDTVYYPVAAQVQAVMVKVWTPETKLPGEFTALLFGPGLAQPARLDELKLTLRRLWRDTLVPVIVDASALDWLTLDPVPRQAIRIITPHPGEAARLLKTTVAAVQADRVAAVREISRRFGNCWVVLKGQHTVVGRSDGPWFVNSTGNPHLAQGGSGDLLAGFLAGLLAQPAMQAEPLRAIRFAVWEHGAAADRLLRCHPNWVVEELATELGGGQG